MARQANRPPRGFEALISFIRERRGFDLSGYKRTSLQRRIRRRMADVKISSIDQYRAFLQSNPEEFTALLNTILINVTGFYRDADAWDYLKSKIIPHIVRTADQQKRPLKVWSVGCSTGEEAYTLAMLFAEAMGDEHYREGLKVYATDVDEEALQQARKGIYSDDAIADLPEPLRSVYAEKTSEGWLISRNLRQVVIFGKHNIVEDPVISNVDLLVCRNLLIYLDSPTQGRILPRLHYALANEGVLFLGKAETLLAHSDDFRAISAKFRLFHKKRAVSALSLAADAAGPANDKRSAESHTLPRLLDILIDDLDDAHLALNQDQTLIYFNRMAREWFGLDEDDLNRPMEQIELSFRPVDLRPMLKEASTQLHPVVHERCECFSFQGDPLVLTVTVRPLQDEIGRLAGICVCYRNASEADNLQRMLQESNENLETTTEELQSSNEELETTNEELQSTNEELETTNEELQSTNEELETTNEELRSTNEELETANEELRQRSDELAEYQATMDRLLGSIHVGIFVLDSAGRVELTNREVETLWGISGEDARGKHIFKVGVAPIRSDAQRKMRPVIAGERNFATVGTEVRNVNGNVMRCQISAARIDHDGSRRGTILFVDDMTVIESLKLQVSEGKKLVDGIIKTARCPLLILDNELRVVATNAAYSRTFKTTEKATVGQSFYRLGNGQWDTPRFNDLLGRVVLRDAVVRDFKASVESAPLGPMHFTINARRFGKLREKDTLIVLSIQVRSGEGERARRRANARRR